MKSPHKIIIISTKRCQIACHTKTMSLCGPHHSSTTHINDLAIIEWQLEEVSWDTCYFKTSHEGHSNQCSKSFSMPH